MGLGRKSQEDNPYIYTIWNMFSMVMIGFAAGLGAVIILSS